MWSIHYLIALNDLLRASRSADIKILQASSKDAERIGIFIQLEGEELTYELEAPKNDIMRQLKLDAGYIKRFKLSEELLTPLQCNVYQNLSAEEVDEAMAVQMALAEFIFQSLEVIEIVSISETDKIICVEYRAQGAKRSRVSCLQLECDYRICCEVLAAAKCVRSGYWLAEEKGSGVIVVQTPLGREYSFDIQSSSCECSRFQQYRSCEHSQLAMQFRRNRSIYSVVKRSV